MSSSFFIWNSLFFRFPKAPSLSDQKTHFLSIVVDFTKFLNQNNLSFCFETERGLHWPVIIQNFVSNNWCKNVILELARFRIINISRWSWCQNIVALVSVSTAFFYYSQGSERDLNFRALTVTSYHNKPTWKLSRTDKHWSSWSGANERKKSKDIKFSRRRREIEFDRKIKHFTLKWNQSGQV